MEKKEEYKYYSTLRPVDIGTFPETRENPLLRLNNYDERIPVEGGAFRAWGELFYAQPLTERQISDYELRPARQNLDVRRTMDAQAQIVGKWEKANHIPDQKRLTWFYPDFGSYVVKEFVTPERLAERVGDIEALRAARAYKKAEQPQQGYFYKMHANPRSDGIENRFFLQAYESKADGKAIPRDVLFIGTPDKCRELLGRLTDGTLTRGQVKEMFKKEMEPPPIAAQLKAAEKLAGENRAQPAPKKDAPDKGDR